MPHFPFRQKYSHKGQNGKIVFVGGNALYHGAPLLAGLGAEKTGVDLLFLYIPPLHEIPIRMASPNFIVSPFSKNYFTPEDVPAVLKSLQQSQSLVIGNGFGSHLETKKALISLLQSISQELPNLPVILDAEAIIPEVLTIPQHHQFLITPHVREYERIFGEFPSQESMQYHAKKYSMTIVLKGVIDRITSSYGEYMENTTGSAIMTVGGTGDALSGIIGGFLAQGMTPLEASIAGTFFWGKCGETLEKTQYSATALEMLAVLPFIIKKESQK